MKPFFAAIILWALSLSLAHAVILYNADNNATTNDPGTGVPFGNVVGIYNAAGALTGSAVYLDNGYFLTANHVALAIGSTFSFDGSTFYAIDTGAYLPTQVGGTDLKLFYTASSVVSALPSVQIANANLDLIGYYSTHGNLPMVTVIGAGAGRADGAALGSAAVAWGGVASYDIRWGTNRLEGFQEVTSGSYTYDAYITVNNAGGASSTGSTEAAMGVFDSGGVAFYYDQAQGQWFLMGIATAVAVNGTSYFYSANGAYDINQCINVFISLADYATAIDDVVSFVPEPSMASAVLGLGALAFMLRQRRHKRG